MRGFIIGLYYCTHIVVEGLLLFSIWHFLLIAPQSTFDIYLHYAKVVNQSHGVVRVSHEILAIPEML